MSKQLSIDTFFKFSKIQTNTNVLKENGGVSGQFSGINHGGVMKKNRFSLKKPTTPSKSSNMTTDTNTWVPTENVDVVNLISDDEDTDLMNAVDLVECVLNSSQLSSASDSAVSESSQRTVIYDISSESIDRTFVTPSKIPITPTKSPITPTRTPACHILTPTTSSTSSPGSKNKFYSPTKKRTVVKRSPVKRKLDQDFAQVTDNDDYFKACDGMDDKTIFLLEIIHKFLNNKSLKRLLSEESQLLLSSCMKVIKPGMMIVCRLYWRKRGWYRSKQIEDMTLKVKQLDESSFQVMINSLVSAGLLDQNIPGESGLSFDDFISLLKADELKQICKELKLKIQSKSKQDVVDMLKKFCQSQSISNYFTGNLKTNSKRVIQIMNEKAGVCYRLSEFTRSTLYRLYVLMYLGIDYNHIRDKKLELLLINDKIKRETYPVDADMSLDDASVVFESKQQFDSYKSLPPWLRRFTPSNIYVKILDAGIQELKKHKSIEYYELAVEILDLLISQIAFRQHKKAEWYMEKAIILRYLGRNDEAAEVLLQGFNSDLPEDAKDSLRPRARNIANQASQQLKSDLLRQADKETILENKLPANHICKQPMERAQQRGKLKFKTRVGGELTVQDAEDYCITHYIDSGKYTHGKHWEGRFAITIFFLLFWDIIYSKPRGVVGIFLSRFQMYPLDMFSDSFYMNRKALIDKRLELIKHSTTEDMLNLMNCTWDSRPEGEVSGVWLAGAERAACTAAARALQPAGAAALCQRLAVHYRYCSAGFPDLTLWNVHTNQIKFVEVKTDTDKPSMKQIQWMHYLKQNGIETEFCYVGVNTTRSKSRAS
ncbi:fanconi-associated nuclease 1-like isoform X2 [Galleria mellonella]|uniref:Fanconi-associated nuclease n=1 Tax=Galleria mellonella TaxID=7137 RepID=A0A6J1X7Y7_GALME|nr:fanconi-associated nuclease 1-like isoform X2 [Galleria mellonella]